MPSGAAQLSANSAFLCVSDVCEEEVMPKVKRSKKKPPEGWELIEPTLDELEQKMREGEYFHQASCPNKPW